jgi:hypothetical protein
MEKQLIFKSKWQFTSLLQGKIKPFLQSGRYNEVFLGTSARAEQGVFQKWIFPVYYIDPRSLYRTVFVQKAALLQKMDAFYDRDSNF